MSFGTSKLIRFVYIAIDMVLKPPGEGGRGFTRLLISERIVASVIHEPLLVFLLFCW